jgi:hypothetical protein
MPSGDLQAWNRGVEGVYRFAGTSGEGKAFPRFPTEFQWTIDC